MRGLFEAEGFRCDSLLVHEKTVQNRAQGISMERRWIQAVFTFIGRGSIPTSPPGQLHFGPGDSHHISPAQSRRRSPRQEEAAHGSLHTAATGVDNHLVGVGDRDDAHLEAASCARAGHADRKGAASRGGDAGPELEWEMCAGDGVLGSDVGNMFQEPMEMSTELVTLQQDPCLCVKVLSSHPPTSVLSLQNRP